MEAVVDTAISPTAFSFLLNKTIYQYFSDKGHYGEPTPYSALLVVTFIIKLQKSRKGNGRKENKMSGDGVASGEGSGNAQIDEYTNATVEKEEMDLQTIGDLQSQLTTHPDPGMALMLQDAIRHAIDNKGLTQKNQLNPESLEEIRQSIYDLNDPSRQDPQADPTTTLLQAMMSSFSNQGSGNTIEDALQYIERLQRQLT